MIQISIIFVFRIKCFLHRFPICFEFHGVPYGRVLGLRKEKDNFVIDYNITSDVHA